MNREEVKNRLKKEKLKGYSESAIIKRTKALIKKHDGDIDESEALNKVIKSIKFNEPLFKKDINIFKEVVSPKTLLLWIDERFKPLKECFKPYGLNLPFSDYDTVCKWIEKESKEGILTTQRILGPTYEGKEWWEVVRDFGWIDLCELPMLYRVSDDSGVVIDCQHSLFLRCLRGAINSVVTYTGFDEISLLKYFFCNIEPKLKRIRGKKSVFVGYRFIFELNANDITREEFESIYRSYREEIGETHKKRLGPKMIEFALFIEKRNIPDTPTKKDYDNLIRAWINEFPEKRNEWIIITPTGKEELNYRKMRAQYDRYKEKKIDLGYLKYLNKSENGKGE